MNHNNLSRLGIGTLKTRVENFWAGSPGPLSSPDSNPMVYQSKFNFLVKSISVNIPTRAKREATGILVNLPARTKRKAKGVLVNLPLRAKR